MQSFSIFQKYYSKILIVRRLMRYFLLGYALLGFTIDANACMCASGTIAENYAYSEVVFLAKVLNVKRVPVPKRLKGDEWLDSPGHPSSVVIRARFELIESYKGTPNALDAVYTHKSGATCGLPIAARDEYVFFSDARGLVHLCGGNILKRQAVGWSDALRELGRLRSELSNKSLEQPGYE